MHPHLCSHQCLVETRLSCETNCGRTKKPQPMVSRSLSRHIQCCCPEFFVRCFMSINWVLWVLLAMEYLRWMLSNKHSEEKLLFSFHPVQVRLLGLSAEPYATDKGKLNVFHSLLHTHTQGFSFHSVSGFFWAFLPCSPDQRSIISIRLFFSLGTLFSVSNLLNCQKWEYFSTHAYTQKYMCVCLYTHV